MLCPQCGSDIGSCKTPEAANGCPLYWNSRNWKEAVKPMEIRCDVIKIAYRQTKEGHVVSFAIHHGDKEAKEVIANAEFGSQWQLTLVPLDDDGNPQQ